MAALLFAVLPLAPPALAGSRWLSNDGFAEEGSAYFQGGFVADECWGSIYPLDPAELPVEATYVRMLVGGTTDEADFGLHVYAVADTEMADVVELAAEAVSIRGADAAWNDVALDDLGLDVFTGGNVAVAVCLDGHDAYPAIARDADGVSDNALNWIWTGGAWRRSSSLGVSGDWVMRVCITGDGVLNEGCHPDPLAIEGISPDRATAGEPVEVTLSGDGFVVGTVATIGGVAITGQEILDEQTISGMSPSDLEAGTYDVEVVLGERALLAGAFTVEPAETTCGCAGAPGSRPWAALAVAALWIFRRRPTR